MSEDVTTAIRPTQTQRRENLLEDLKKPGWVVVTKDGLLKPEPKLEDASK